MSICCLLVLCLRCSKWRPGKSVLENMAKHKGPRVHAQTEILAFCQSRTGPVVKEVKILMNVLQFIWKKEWRTRWMNSNRAIN